MSRQYKRNFVTLKQERSDYSLNGKQALGRCIIETKTEKSKLSIYVQDLKPQILYKAYLIAGDTNESLGISVGTINVDAKGKGELKWEFDANDVHSTKKCVEEFNVVSVIAPKKGDVIAVMTGFIKDEIMWKNNFIDFADKKEVESLIQTKGIQAEKTKNEEEAKEIESEEIKGEEEAKGVESEEIKDEEEAKEVESEEIKDKEKAKEVETEKIKDKEETKEIELEEIKNEEEIKEIESEKIKNEEETKEIESEKIKEVESEEIKDEEETKEIELEEIKDEEEAKEVKSDKTKMEESELAFMQAEEIVSKEREEGIKKQERRLHSNENTLHQSEQEREKEVKSTEWTVLDESDTAAESKFKKIIQEYDAIMKSLQNSDFEDRLRGRTREKPSAKEVNSEKIELQGVAYVFANYAELFPFERQEKEIRWVRITLKDLLLLDIDSCSYMNHPFVTASYRRYKHLLLGKYKDNEKKKYILGMPDFYSVEYKEIANELGFERFQYCDSAEFDARDYGYWLKDI